MIKVPSQYTHSLTKNVNNNNILQNKRACRDIKPKKQDWDGTLINNKINLTTSTKHLYISKHVPVAANTKNLYLCRVVMCKWYLLRLSQS